MITKELSEAAVELNVILENSSKEVLAKIPNKFRNFMKEIESKTYKFDYDSNKSLNEQKIKPETRRLLALVYRDYLCTNEQKQEYIKLSNDFFEEYNRLKYEKYNVENIFKRERKIENDKKDKELLINKEQDNIINKIINYIKKIFTK